MGDFIKMKKEEIKESYKHASLKRKINTIFKKEFGKGILKKGKTKSQTENRK